MAYIHCVNGGGGGSVEVVDGTMTGASGATSAGQITVTSPTGKTPKRAQFWNSSNLASNMNTIVWNSDYPNTSMARTGSNTVSARQVGATAVGTLPTVSAVGATSVTFLCSTNSTYYTGTWKYYVEFE